ncbi:nucleotidyltransferase family protein [Acinetobacter sp. YH12126]|uniref:nucleotidyltransferase family protein n=1 Tax=Acinetobacter sp. YH12126 TaxID=2601111 RepID=UPI00211F34E9|nr:nucleotidyltransferase family protein [Acinetobacter sp. YH12126]
MRLCQAKSNQRIEFNRVSMSHPMHPVNQSQLEATYVERLQQLIQQHDGIMSILKQLYLVDASAYIAAGVIRNMLWSVLHQHSYTLSHTEVDIIFYDAEDNGAHSDQIQKEMQSFFPLIQWDVTNQATVHQWYRLENGEQIQALKSIEHALSLWPETATAIAVKLDDQQKIQLIAPLGLDDLFELKLRWNSTLVSRATFLQRIEAKKFFQRWPKLKLLMTPEA